jgi:2'-5' RNA ligase
MSTINVSLPGYRINEYRLVVPLSESLQEKVSQIRKTLHEKHKIKFPFQIKPSLTVMTCHAFEKMEARLLDRIQHVALGLNPFKVELQDYCAYPSHTIYIGVQTKSPFNDLVKELKSVRSIVRIPEHEPHFIKEPHLLIAQKLKPFQFVNMWLECEHSSFSGRYMADAMILLKRNQANTRYEAVRRFEFMSLPMQVKQGDLFSV